MVYVTLAAGELSAPSSAFFFCEWDIQLLCLWQEVHSGEEEKNWLVYEFGN